jgi:hypothetical protein
MTRDNIGLVAAANVLDKKTKTGARYRALVPELPAEKRLVPHCSVVVDFAGNELTEKIEGTMSQYGFQKEVSGRRTYYRGPPTLASAEAFSSNGIHAEPIGFSC